MSDNGTTFNPFGKSSSSSGSSSSSSGGDGFLDSNSLVARFAFLLLVIFVFVILLRLGINLIAWFLLPSSSPHLIDGMVDAKQMLVFPQDPGSSGAVTIRRSVNANDGVEFTWSVWIYIDDLQYMKGQYRHIFHKGNNNVYENGLNFPNNAPGLYIAPNTNALVVMMNTYNVINEEIVIPDIPLNKWVNVIIRCENKKLDVYINGTITRSINLVGVPKQNYGDVYVAMNGGFSGNISNLWYYNYALGTAEIHNLARSGPNLKFTGTSAMLQRNPDYLSLRWYFYGAGDQFNPTPEPVHPILANKLK